MLSCVLLVYISCLLLVIRQTNYQVSLLRLLSFTEAKWLASCLCISPKVIPVSVTDKHSKKQVNIQIIIQRISLVILFVTFQIFTRILRSLNLPVGTSQMIVPRYVTNAYDISHVVLWVSALLVSS